MISADVSIGSKIPSQLNSDQAVKRIALLTRRVSPIAFPLPATWVVRFGGRVRSLPRKFTIERVELGEANAFVCQHHRHHKPVVGHLFSLGAAFESKIVGVSIIGRPV